MPDNLSSTPKGNIFVSLVILKSDKSSPLDFIYRQPWLTKLILRIFHLIKIAMGFIKTVLEYSAIRDLVPKVSNYKIALLIQICFIV